MDSQRCEEAGEHQSTTRHTREECPVTNTIRTEEGETNLRLFEARASDDEVKTDLELTCTNCGEVLCDIEAGDDLATLFSTAVGHLCDPPVKRVPDFKMDVHGRYVGNPYPESAEYRIGIEPNKPDATEFLMTVVTTSGGMVGTHVITEEETDGILRMGTTDHSLSGYEDDWKIPVGMDRTVEWTLQTDMDHEVRLDQSGIDQVAAWLSFATGEQEWTGGDEWEY